MKQNGQTAMKTSKLEDQYAVIFGLARWLREPCEVNLKKLVFTKCGPIVLQRYYTQTSLSSNMSRENIQSTTTVSGCLLYTSPSPRDLSTSRMPSSA